MSEASQKYPELSNALKKVDKASRLHLSVGIVTQEELPESPMSPELDALVKATRLSIADIESALVRIFKEKASGFDLSEESEEELDRSIEAIKLQIRTAALNRTEAPQDVHETFDDLVRSQTQRIELRREIEQEQVGFLRALLDSKPDLWAMFQKAGL